MFERGGYVARRLVPLGMAAVILTGCAAAPSSTSTSTSAVSTPHPLASSTLPAAVGSSQPRLPPSATAASLVGLSSKELTSLLGAPAWTRRENPAEVWQYRGTACVLDVYFYEESGTPRVLYAEARDEAAHPVTLAQCLERIEAYRRPNPSS